MLVLVSTGKRLFGTGWETMDVDRVTHIWLCETKSRKELGITIKTLTWETEQMDVLLIVADNNERTEKLGRRETMGHGLLFLFCFLFKTGSSYYLAVLELVIWPNLALNSQISTWVGGLMACTSMLGYENFFLPLPSVLSTGVSALFPLRPAMVVQVSNSSSWEAEAARSGVQDCFWLHRECEVSLNYKRPCLKKTVTMMPPPLEVGWGFMAALVNRMLKFNLQS